MTSVEIATGAWFGDRPFSLTFPPAWEVCVVGKSPGPPLDPDAMRERLRAPIGTPRLSELARGRRSAVVIIDDISRPTPTAELLPLVLEELAAGGLAASQVRIVTASDEDNLKKIGAATAGCVGFEVHDPDGELHYAGKSPAGIPLHINRTVMAAELKIGIGGIGPHDSAGYSGGSKIIVPGVAGTQTARYLHDFMRTARERGGSIDNEFRHELDAISGRLGLDFIVNVVLDHRRQVAGLFAGDRVLAHREGVGMAAKVFSVTPVADAQIVVANTYPFDASLWFVPWGLWPLLHAPPGATRVLIADGSQGRGGHRLKPQHLSFVQRAWTRFLTLRPRHVLKQARHLVGSLRRTKHRRNMEMLMLCPNASAADVASRYPGAVHHRSWDDLLADLKRRHPGGRVRVAVYPCAPLQVPRAVEGGR
jgi:lactate racemase